jgi:kynureninase
MHPNASAAAAVVCSALAWDPPRNGIVHTALDFPSLIYLFEALEKRGARRAVVPSDDGITIDEERVVEAIDETTALVSISHVLFRSSALLDVRPIIAKARAVGARVLLDSYHAVGVLPVDVTALDADFLVGGSVKWLCGGPGAGYLYVSPRLRDALEPWVTGWMAHEDPFAFEPGMRHARGPFRWLGGTPQVPCCLMARPGYATVRRVGVEAIRAKSRRLTQRLIGRADEEGWEVRSPRDPDRRGGAVCLGVPHAEAVAAELIRRDVIVDARPGSGVRVGPHFYNTEEEVERVAREMKEILSTRAYERHLGAPPRGGREPAQGARP